jgi:hypothetical protein
MEEEYSLYDILNHVLLISQDQLNAHAIVEWCISHKHIVILFMAVSHWFEVDPATLQNITQEFEGMFGACAQRLYPDSPIEVKVVIEREFGPVPRIRKQTPFKRIRTIWKRILPI